MHYAILQQGVSRSFPEGDAFLAKASPERHADVLFCLRAPRRKSHRYAAVAIELGTECLADHVGIERSPPMSSASRAIEMDRTFLRGLVELVRLRIRCRTLCKPFAPVLEDAGLKVAVCSDQAGRIIDRLVRPKYNAALGFSMRRSRHSPIWT